MKFLKKNTQTPSLKIYKSVPNFEKTVPGTQTAHSAQEENQTDQNTAIQVNQDEQLEQKVSFLQNEIERLKQNLKPEEGNRARSENNDSHLNSTITVTSRESVPRTDHYGLQDLESEDLGPSRVNWSLLKSVNLRKKKKENNGIAITSETEADRNFMSPERLKSFLKERNDEIKSMFGNSSALSLLALAGVEVERAPNYEEEILKS